MAARRKRNASEKKPSDQPTLPEGYLKLWRSMSDTDLARDTEAFGFYVFAALRASLYKEVRMLRIGGKTVPISLLPGDYLFSESKLCQYIQMPVDTLRQIVYRLEKYKMSVLYEVVGDVKKLAILNWHEIADKEAIGQMPTRKRWRPEWTELPEELGESFRPKWVEWCRWRRTERKRLTQRTAAAQLALLAEMGPKMAAESINLSIRCGWQGLFWPDGSGRSRRGKPLAHKMDEFTKAERERAQLKKSIDDYIHGD